MHALARFAQRLLQRGRAGCGRSRSSREYEKTILDELDLMREARERRAAAAQLRQAPTLLYVPEVHWDYCRADVMVMERIHGVLISDARRAAGAAARTSSGSPRTACEIFFTQVFRHNFFHADMHPGNIFVRARRTRQHPRYAAVDFGIVGTLDPRDQHYLAENFLAFFERDYQPRRAGCTSIPAGCPRSTRVDELESAVRTVCEPIFRQAARARSPSRRCCCGCSRPRGASRCRCSRS